MGEVSVLLVDEDPQVLAELRQATPRSVNVLTADSLDGAVTEMENAKTLAAVVVGASLRWGAAVVREALHLHPAARRIVIGSSTTSGTRSGAWVLARLCRRFQRRRPRLERSHPYLGKWRGLLDDD